MRSFVYYVASSMDGFIADPHGKTDAFPLHRETLLALFARLPETCPAHLRDVLGVHGPPRRFDTVIMGYSTHEVALKTGLSSAYPHLRQIVATHRSLPPDPTVTAISGDVAQRIRDLKSTAGADIWLCGGGHLASQLLDQIDEIHLKINPVTLHAGIPLFRDGAPREWDLTSSEQLPGGVLLAHHRAPRLAPRAIEVTAQE